MQIKICPIRTLWLSVRRLLGNGTEAVEVAVVLCGDGEVLAVEEITLPIHLQTRLKSARGTLQDGHTNERNSFFADLQRSTIRRALGCVISPPGPLWLRGRAHAT